MEHKRDVEYFYSLTRSDEYRSVVNAINQISPYIEEIAGALEFIRLGWLANYIRMIPLAGEIMDEATKRSGTAKNAVDAMELFPPEKLRDMLIR